MGQQRCAVSQKVEFVVTALPVFRRSAICEPTGSNQSATRRWVTSSCAQVARELGIRDNLLTRWKRELEGSGKGAFVGSGTARDEEMSRLKRELARVTKERDFLRAAATFFAKGSS